MERMIVNHVTSHDVDDIELGEHSDQGVRNISDWVDSYIREMRYSIEKARDYSSPIEWYKWDITRRQTEARQG